MSTDVLAKCIFVSKYYNFYTDAIAYKTNCLTEKKYQQYSINICQLFKNT